MSPSPQHFKITVDIGKKKRYNLFMAYLSPDKKKSIVAELKTIFPANWKWTARVRNHSTFVLTIWSAPADLLSYGKNPNPLWQTDGATPTYGSINPYWWKTYFPINGAPDDLMALFEEVFAALNRGNHDNSDICTDYFDVGWYVDVKVGEYGKPFIVTK